MALEKMIGELKSRKAKALQQGGPEKIKRHHGQGKLTARERIDKLLDPGSFVELGMLCTSDMPGMQDKTPADSVILGFGSVGGRKIAVIANDFTVLASTDARVKVKKMFQFKTQAKKYAIPLIWLGEAGGARLPDSQGADNMLTLAGDAPDSLMPEYIHFREHPVIFAAMGECHGLADFQACVADFVVQVKGSSIAVSGPRALGKAIGERVSSKEMGGWKLHSQLTGMTDRVAENEEECLKLIKIFLDYMPSNNQECPPVKAVPKDSDARMKKIPEILPDNRKRTYDMHKIIECIVDGGEYFELKPDFGNMLITCLSRINGHVIGIIANNPLVNAGATNTDALDKHTSFLCLCDSFNIPILFLTDTPGHLTGMDAERNRVGAKVVTNLQALFQVTVPRISIVIRKAFGQGALNMSGTGTGPDFYVAWPSAEIGFMDPLIAADVIYGGLPEQERQRMVNKMMADTSPFPAASKYCLQDIIDPLETRAYLIKTLDIIRNTKSRGMGRHLLSNWPTKF